MPGRDIEIYYALHGGEPMLIGGGSFDELGRIVDEVEAMDSRDGSRPGVGANTEHFFQELGKTAQVLPLTEGALAHYSDLAEASRQVLLDRLRAGGEE